MARRPAGVAVVVACVAFLTGCSGIPSGGPTRVVRAVPPEGPEPPEPQVVRRVPNNPPPDASPDSIVRSYLTALNDPQGGYALARRYLDPQAEWNANGRTVVYTARHIGEAVVTGQRATIRVTVDPVGTISTAGEYQPRSAPVTTTYTLRLLPAIGWRLADAPAGLLLPAEAVAASFQRATLYWPDQARRLVPDLVFLRAGDQPVANVVRALLAGPRGWLAPAVRTAIPKGTELLDPPDFGDGVVTLNFSREIRGIPEEALGTLVAQVVWTLTERGEVQAVRLLAEGEPLAVPGRPGVREHRRADWIDAAPVPATADRRLFFVRNGAAYAYDEAGRPSRVARTPPLASLAVNRSGTALAAVTRPSGGRQSLLVVDLTGRSATRTAVTADRITAPAWEPGGQVVWAVQTNGTGQQIVAVPASGGLFTTVAIPSALPSPITSLRLSPDGARAAVIAGTGRAAGLWLARIERPASPGRVLAEPLRIVPTARGVTAVAFDGTSQLLYSTYAGGAKARPVVVRVDVDGYASTVLDANGLPAAPVRALAVSAAVPLDRVASVDGQLWRTSGTLWAPLRDRGGTATFAG